MTDWRATASPEAQSDLDDLLNVALTAGVEHLARRGVLAPFAIVTDDGGEQRPLMVLDDVDSETLESMLMDEATRMRDDLRAAAFVADVSDVRLGGDALRVILEHRDGIGMAVYLPYRTGSEGPIYGDLIAGDVARRVWP